MIYTFAKSEAQIGSISTLAAFVSAWTLSGYICAGGGVSSGEMGKMVLFRGGKLLTVISTSSSARMRHAYDTASSELLDIVA